MNPEIENAVNQIVEHLKKNKSAKVEWDCGGDEAIMSFYLDNKAVSYDKKDFWALGDWLVDKLDLPSVGEIFAKGGGSFVVKNDILFLDYNTTWTQEEENEENEYDEENEYENDEAGEYYHNEDEGYEPEEPKELNPLESYEFMPEHRYKMYGVWMLSGTLAGRCLIAEL